MFTPMVEIIFVFQEYLQKCNNRRDITEQAYFVGSVETDTSLDTLLSSSAMIGSSDQFCLCKKEGGSDAMMTPEVLEAAGCRHKVKI